MNGSLISLLISWVVSALVIFALAFILPGVSVDGFLVALVVAIVIGPINGFVRPLAIFLTLPANILTLGLFTFVVDALLIMLAAWLVPGFTITNFWWALLFVIILAIVNGLIKPGRQIRSESSSEPRPRTEVTPRQEEEEQGAEQQN